MQIKVHLRIGVDRAPVDPHSSAWCCSCGHLHLFIQHLLVIHGAMLGPTVSSAGALVIRPVYKSRSIGLSRYGSQKQKFKQSNNDTKCEPHVQKGGECTIYFSRSNIWLLFARCMYVFFAAPTEVDDAPAKCSLWISVSCLRACIVYVHACTNAAI